MSFPSKLQTLREKWRDFKHAYNRFTSRFVPPIRMGCNILNVITFVASVVCIVTLIIYFGFNHTPGGVANMLHVLRGCQITFLINIIYNASLRFRHTVCETKAIKWIVDIAMLVTLLPLIYPRPEHPWIPFLETLLYSHRFLFPVLCAYSIVEISYGIIRVLGKRTNPSLILSASFGLFIIIGSVLLMMPKCTYGEISYVDSLFVSTSAVCITGLTTVDVATTFTNGGLMIIALLIQIGGLGVMTFTSFFALFFSGNTSIYSQLLVRDMIYSKSLNSLLPTLLYIFGVTIIVELIGAAGIFLCIHDKLGMDLQEELIFSGFHSLSAFCNAGFSNIEGGLSNPLLFHSNQIVYIVVTLLVTAGGIGFPTLINLRQAVGNFFRRNWNRLKRRRNLPLTVHTIDLNTKIVLVTSVWITVVSTLLFLWFEYSNSLAGMPLSDKLIQSWFNSSVPRSSGFSSVNPAGFHYTTILMFIFLMWIGGASQSTAGGIKVNTFATMLLNLKAIILGRDHVTAYGRSIAIPSIRRAHAVVGLSIISLFLICIVLVALEPALPLLPLIYDAVSALFTVGSSLGVTPLLSDPSKILLCMAMFLGRVGIISLLVGVVGVHTDPPYRLPSDNIIIN